MSELIFGQHQSHFYALRNNSNNLGTFTATRRASSDVNCLAAVVLRLHALSDVAAEAIERRAASHLLVQRDPPTRTTLAHIKKCGSVAAVGQFFRDQDALRGISSEGFNWCGGRHARPHIFSLRGGSPFCGRWFFEMDPVSVYRVNVTIKDSLFFIYLFSPFRL